MKLPRARVAMVVTCLLFVSSCGGGEGRPAGEAGAAAMLKVMTRNVFLGAELDDVIAAASVAEIPARVAAFWQAVQASDFPGRARLLADEVAAERPDLLAVQELELFRLQAPSNFAPGAPATDADTVAPAGDLLAILQAELESRGLDYGPPAVVATHTDTEMPGQDATGASFDLRLTDRDAIFVRRGLSVSNPRSAAFPTFISLPVGGLPGGIVVKLVRGWAAVDVVAEGVPLTFVNTHLEVGGRATVFQEAQAENLVAALAPITGPVVLAGDFNSDAGGTTTRSYAIVTRAFTDAWPQANPSDPGLTCCTDVANTAPRERIDLVLHRGKVRVVSAARVGVDTGQRTPGGLPPSDHAGVVATLAIGP